MRIGIDDILAGHGIGTGGGSGGGRLEPKSARVTTSNVTSVVDVPATLGFNPAKDMMMVFQNSIFIDKGVDYTLSEDASTIIATDGDWTVGTILDFLVITNTKTDLPTYDGSLIGDGTITEAKLSQAILDRIEASANFDSVLGRVNEVEMKMRQLREVAANAQLQMEATELVASGQSFGGNGHFSFGAPMDMAKTTTTNILDVGATVLTGKVAKHDAFKVGQTVTIYDDVNTEAVVVTKSTATELEVSALTKGYKSGAVIARSTLVPHIDGGYEYPNWNTTRGPGIARLSLGMSDEIVMWVTSDDSANLTLHNLSESGKAIVYPSTVQQLSKSVDFETSEIELNLNLSKVDNSYEIWGRSDSLTPSQIALDKDKNVYVTYQTDATNVPTVRKFDKNGNELWNKRYEKFAKAITIDALGNVYIGYYVSTGKTLQKLDPSGNEIWSKADIPLVNSLDTDSFGNLYIGSETSSKSLIKVDTQGNELWSKSNIPFTRGVHLDSENNLYAVYNGDVGTITLQKFNHDGILVWSNSEVPFCQHVTVDRDGYPYVVASAATGYKNVRKLDSSGSEVWALTDSGNAYGIDCDVAGNVYVAYLLTSGKTVRKFDKFGNELWNKQNVPNARYLCVDEEGSLYVAYQVGSGNSVRKYVAIPQTIWSNSDSKYASDIKIDHEDNIYVAYDSGTNDKKVRKLDKTGVELWSDRNVYNAKSIDLDSKGYVYVGYNAPIGQKSLRKLDSNGIEVWSKTEDEYCMDVKVDAFDNVYAVYNGGAGKKTLRKFDSSGAELWSDSSITKAAAVTTDKDGNVYVCYSQSAGAKVIRKFSSAGVELWFDTQIGNASGIEVAPDNSIYITYYQSLGTTLRKLSPNGSELWANASVPYGKNVKIDRFGDVYVINWMSSGNKTLRKLNPNGVEIWSFYETGFASSLDFDKSNDLFVVFGTEARLTTIRKLAFPRMTKTWVSDINGNKIILRTTTPSELNISVNSNLIIMKKNIMNYELDLSDEALVNGENEIVIEIVGVGKERWTAKKDGKHLKVTQWVMTSEVATSCELQLDIEGNSKLYKYLGAIG